MMKLNLLPSLLAISIALCSMSCRKPEIWIPRRVVGMEYPELCSRARIEGQVRVACQINPDGAVISTLVDGKAHPLLSKPAQENAMKWIFMKDNNSNDSNNTVVLIYSFKMEGKGSNRPRSQFVFEYPNSVKIQSDFWNIQTANQDAAAGN